MKILTGKYKGRIIQMPKGIRPTQNIVRKAIFDIISDRIAGANFLELFAGSGAVGFEALSRGASYLTLVENNLSCTQSLNKTIKNLDLKNVRLLFMDVLGAMEFLYDRKDKFEIIFLDPPYSQGLINKTLKESLDYDILNDNALVIVQHYKKDLLSKEAGFLKLWTCKKYGDTMLTFYSKERS